MLIMTYSIITINDSESIDITRDQSHNSSAAHTFNVMIPTKQTSAEDTPAYYECIGQGSYRSLYTANPCNDSSCNRWR